MDENTIRRILPHSAEAEQAVIGSMLMSREAIQTASEVITGDDFYQSQYGIIFNTMVELFDAGSEVDLVTLQNALREKNVPPEISDLEYVRELLEAVPTSANIRNYANIVAEKSILRNLIRLTEEIGSTCYKGSESVERILEDSEKKLFTLFQRGNTRDIIPIHDAVMQSLESIEKAARTKGNVTGLASGFADLDYNTSGFQNSDLILLAARPSMGKTAMLLNMAENMAIKKNKRVLIFSLEMSRQQLVNRLLSMGTQIDMQRLRNGNLRDDEWSSLVETAGVIGQSNLMIDDTPGITVRELRSKCRKIQLEYGLDAVMIDYLQMFPMSGNRGAESQQQHISEVSRSLKTLARELDVPVITLSQLSRAVEQRGGDHRPILSDLRDSGAIEQDADVVMFLYREDYYDKDSEKKNICEVIIAKQRNGPIGTVELLWRPEYTKFVTLERKKRG